MKTAKLSSCPFKFADRLTPAKVRKNESHKWTVERPGEILPLFFCVDIFLSIFQVNSYIIGSADLLSRRVL